MTSRTQILTVFATLVFALGIADANAQFGTKGGFGGSRGSRDQSGGKDNRSIRPPQQDNDSYEIIDYRLSLLEEDLRLQPGQRGLWESFAVKVRAFARDLARARARAMSIQAAGAPGSGGIQHIEQATDAARNRVTALEDISVAAKKLYAGLTPDQAKLADMRMATIVAPPSRAASDQSGDNLPDLGSSNRTQR